MDIGDPVDRLPGVGPVRKKTLEAAGVTTIGDLMVHLPSHYQDRRVVTEIASIPPQGGSFLLAGCIDRIRSRRARRRGMYLVEGSFEDDSGRLPVVWFNQRWIGSRLDSDVRTVLYGQVAARPDGALQIVNPEVVGPEGHPGAVGSVVPVYRPIGPISGRVLRRLIQSALPALQGLDDPVPESLRSSNGLVSLSQALSTLHDPPAAQGTSALDELENRCSPAHLRLVFDEMLAFSGGMVMRRRRLQDCEGRQCSISDAMRRRANEMLPFSLTTAQRRVVGEIAADLTARRPMARLIQGDVGSGKTVVAALAMLIAVENGVQTALMAPTELLAGQHHETFQKVFSRTPWNPVLLTGSVSPSEKRAVQAGLADGSIPLVVGTHALVQDAIGFANLGLVVIDEQHRFGAAERQRLVNKGRVPHVLVMTATPIPRSLALTLYGDLDLSVIDELPPGRRPIRTEIRTASSRSRVFDFVRREVAGGGRCFFVFPLIEQSDAFDASALESHVDELTRRLPGIAVGTLHGRMDAAQQDEAYRRFQSGEVQVLAATTVVEVGIDVPQASVMVIESAERFGLAQLHQLRGRVGRGERPSWCVLMVGKDVSPTSRQRLEVFAGTNDGFAIAEADLAMRGPGEMAGFRQWGHIRFRFADLGVHHAIVEKAREAALTLDRMGCLEKVTRGLSRYHRCESEIAVS